MSTYSFLESRWPEIILADDMPGRVSYEVTDNRYTGANWGGVMDVSVARALKPWAKPVRLPLLAYRYGNYDWNALEAGKGLWGTLFQGPMPGNQLIFVLLENGVPMITQLATRPALGKKTGRQA